LPARHRPSVGAEARPELDIRTPTNEVVHESVETSSGLAADSGAPAADDLVALLQPEYKRPAVDVPDIPDE